MIHDSFSVIVTRPQPYADKLSALLIENDFANQVTPLIEFVSNNNWYHEHFVTDLGSTDLLIFISQQAVHYFLEQISESEKELLQHKTLIAVGNATQNLLLQNNLTSLVPTSFDSEGIIDLVLSSHATNANILLIRGNKGRELLETELQKQHTITALETYQRIAIAQDFPVLHQQQSTAVIVTSEQLLNLSVDQLARQLARKVDQKETFDLQTSEKFKHYNYAFICASRRIAEKAQQLGITNCYTAKSASDEDLLKACKQWRKQFSDNEKTILSSIEQRETMSEPDNQENELIEALELDQDANANLKDNDDFNDKPHKNSSITKFIFWILLLAALAYAGYWLWQKFDNSIATEKSTTDITRLVQLEKSLNQQNKQIQTLIATQESQQSKAEQLQQELNHQVETLQQQLSTSQRKFQSLSSDAKTQAKDWQIAEAEYLIRQAAQKLHYSDDLPSIVALLETADQQIVAAGDTNLLALRRAISSDITKIKTIGLVDIDSILVTLDSIQELLPKLELASVKFGKEEVNKDIITEANPTAWNSFKTNVRETFSDYYRVHRYDESVKPFINPQQAGLLEQNLLLNLKMAQLAALRHQQSAFDQSISETKQWIEEFYLTDNYSTVLLEQLKKLSAAKVSLKIPGRLTSLDFIKQNNQQRLNQWLNTPEKVKTVPVQSKPDNSEAFNSDADADELESEDNNGNIEQKIEDSIKRLKKDIPSEADSEETENDGGEQ